MTTPAETVCRHCDVGIVLDQNGRWRAAESGATGCAVTSEAEPWRYHAPRECRTCGHWQHLHGEVGCNVLLGTADGEGDSPCLCDVYRGRPVTAASALAALVALALVLLRVVPLVIR